MAAARNHDSYIDLPQGLRVRVLTSGGAGEDVVVEAVVRRVAADEITLGVLRFPPSAEALVGQPLMIAAQLHGRLYALDSTLLRLQEVPRALIVSMPTEARRTEQRHFYRLNCNIEALASWQAPAVDRVLPHWFLEQPSRLLDISGGGVLLRTRERVPTNAVVRLEFTLDGDAQRIHVEGRALRVQEEQSGTAYRVNMQFEGLDAGTQEQIVRFIFRQQALRTQRRTQ